MSVSPEQLSFGSDVQDIVNPNDIQDAPSSPSLDEFRFSESRSPPIGRHEFPDFPVALDAMSDHFSETMDIDEYNAEEQKRIDSEKTALREVNVCVNNLLDENYLLSKTKLKLKINKITLSSSWKWRDSKDDDACGICRGAFEACCNNCKMPGDDCPLAVGECRHAFHLHCINKWADSQPKPNCPLCRTDWKSAPTAVNRMRRYAALQAAAAEVAAEELNQETS